MSGVRHPFAALVLLTALLGVSTTAGAEGTGDAPFEHAPSCFSASLPADWLEIDVQAREIRVADATIVEVRGRGSLRFREGRRVIGFPEDVTVFVDGVEVSGAETARPGAEVLLVGDDGEVRWTLREAFSIPRQKGTTISDDDPKATAAVDAAEETHFFLHVRSDGITTFFHPTESDVSTIVRGGLDARSLARTKRHAALRSDLATYFQRFAQFGFSGSVLVAEAENVVFSDAYGLADRENQRSFVPSTVLTIGSITKSFTAAAVLKLQDMGLLDVDDPIPAYLPDVPADKQVITLHHLLTHTSGLKRNGLEGGDLNLSASRDSLLQNVLQSELLWAPGGDYSYSNVGYTLLAIIVENVSGLSYEEFVHRHVLVPARMYRTGYLLPRYAPDELAAGYRDGQRLDPVVRLPMLEDGPTWNVRGNGALHSDSYDMFRWFLALRNYEVLSTDALTSMTTSHVEQDGGTSYGYGWEIDRTSRGTRTISHRGGNGYFSADFHWLPDEDQMFFIGSNAASKVNMTRLAGVVQSILLDEPYRLPPLVEAVPEPVLRRYVGEYELPGGDTVVVTYADSALLVRAEGDEAIQAVLGGSRTADDEDVRVVARRSRDLLAAEFRGDLRPKFDAMGGSTPIAALERYHQYDRDVWDERFGALRRIETVAASGEGDEVEVVLRIEFERGAAAQTHTWRAGRLANISVVPDWTEFRFTRTVFPVSQTRFESFSTGSSIQLVARFDRDETGPTGVWSLVLPALPGSPKAHRVDLER